MYKLGEALDFKTLLKTVCQVWESICGSPWDAVCFTLRQDITQTKAPYWNAVSLIWLRSFWQWSTCASSCGEPSDLSGRRPSHRGDTERVDVQCVFGSDGSARPTWRTSIHSLASCNGRAFHLREERDRLASRKHKKQLYAATLIICSWS